MVSLTGTLFYDIPQVSLSEHLNENQDIYLSDAQLTEEETERRSKFEETSK